MTTSTTSGGLSALIVVFLSMVVVAHASSKPPKADIVVEACNNATAVKKVHFTKEFCVSALRSENRSSEAKDYTDLILVAMDLLKGRIDATAAKIDGTLGAGVKGPRAGREFQFCRLDYNDMAGFLALCRDMVQKMFGDMSGCMGRVGEAGRDCIDALDKGDVKEVLSKETDELTMLISLTNTLIAILDSI